MKKLMGTAALAAMIVMGQGISADAGETDHDGDRKRVVYENMADVAKSSIGQDAGCGNGGENGDPGKSLNNNAGDDGSFGECAGTPQSPDAPE